MKKKILFIGLCMILVLSASFVACKPVTTEALSSYENVYGMGAVTTVKLLGGSMSATALKSFSAVNECVGTVKTRKALAQTSETENSVKSQAEEFNRFFCALDSFLGEEIVSTTVKKNTDDAYPYETKMTISGKDFNGNSVTYEMYYTEELEKTEIDDDETESEYRLEGVLVVDGIEFSLEGERSDETEHNETESELKIRAYANAADKTSYIEMEQEFSVEENETETEYVYSIYENGRLIEQTAVEFETERKDGKTETEYELEFRSGEAKGKYVVEREVKNNEIKIKVKYNIDGETGEFSIKEITGSNGEKHYEYTFGDNDKVTF